LPQKQGLLTLTALYNALLEEALANATVIPHGTTTTRVLRAEHLIAIAVQTGASASGSWLTKQRLTWTTCAAF